MNHEANLTVLFLVAISLATEKAVPTQFVIGKILVTTQLAIQLYKL
jgi:hypothetical protein